MTQSSRWLITGTLVGSAALACAAGPAPAASQRLEPALFTYRTSRPIRMIRARTRRDLYANVWQSERIARISPGSGAVLGWIDLGGIWPGRPKADQDAVLNGIAYDADGDRLFVTGKWWPHLYEIALAPTSAPGP